MPQLSSSECLAPAMACTASLTIVSLHGTRAPNQLQGHVAVGCVMNRHSTVLHYQCNAGSQLWCIHLMSTRLNE